MHVILALGATFLLACALLLAVEVLLAIWVMVHAFYVFIIFAVVRLIKCAWQA